MIINNKLLNLILPFIGLLTIFFFYSQIVDNEKLARNQELQDTHKRVVERFDASIEKFATMMSGIKSKFSDEKTPSQKELQNFLRVQTESINFNDSIVISYLDTNHEFIYNFDRYSIDKYGLAGKNVGDLRDSLEINQLNKLLESDKMKLFSPINLVEG